MMTIVLVVAVLLLLVFFGALVLNTLFFSVGKDILAMPDKHKEKEAENRRLEFKSGRNTLVGYLYGKDDAKGLVVMVHGMGVTSSFYLPEVEYFVEKGYKVFSYDAAGYRKGRGTFRGFPQAVRDLDAALSTVDSLGLGLPITIVGHSMGGYSSCAVLNVTPVKVDNVVVYAGFSSIEEVVRLFLEKNFKAPHWIKSLIAGGVVFAQHFFFGKDADLTAVDGIDKAGCNVLLAQGGNDNEVFVDSSAIYAKRDQLKNKNVRCLFFPEGVKATHVGIVRDKEGDVKINLEVLDEAVRMMEGR